MVTSTAYNGNRIQSVPQLGSLLGVGLTPTIHILAVALNYAHPNTPNEDPLKDPVQDMEHIRERLSEFNCVRFTKLYEHEATLKNILRKLRDGLLRCHKGDLFILYLAGHALSLSGYEFITYYERAEEQKNARLRYQDILEYVQAYCPSGVQVLQVRDTCYASPSLEEVQQILLLRDESVMVLAACGVNQVSYERSPVPYSLFLRRIVSTVEMFKSNHPVNEADLRASVTSFLRTILSPIQVPITGGYRQYPQLVPHASQPEFESFLVRFIQQLREPPLE